VEFPEHVQIQSQVSEWAQEQFRAHAARNAEWKASKSDPAYQVVVRAGDNPAWVSTGWSVNRGTKVPFNTISVKLNANTSLCLDFTLSIAGVSVCYPSSDPDTNMDPTQQWIWEDDGSVQSLASTNYCLTAGILTGNETTFLLPCQKNLDAQYFAYNGGSSGIGFGPYTMGIIHATS